MSSMRIVTLLLVIGLAGCGYAIETVANVFVERNVPEDAMAAGHGPGTGSPVKTVAEKRPPKTLVARDGSTCQVPEARFGHVRIGQQVTCVWVSRTFQVIVIGPHY